MNKSTVKHIALLHAITFTIQRKPILEYYVQGPYF